MAMGTTRRRFLTHASLLPAALGFAGGAPRSSRAATDAPGSSATNDATGTVPSDTGALIDTERRRIQELMAHENIPGVSVCFLQAGQPLWQEGFGVTDTHHGHRVSTRTLFSIQSTSKHMTASAILLAVQRGLLDLDTPLSAYLPGFRVNSRFEQAPQQLLTLRLLLSHRAGFTHEAPVGNNFEPASRDFAEHVESIQRTWLRFPVGERYRYSNLGFDLAGHIVEQRSGMPFAKWMRLVLFEPLQMRDTTVDTATYAARGDRALGHEEGYHAVPLQTPLIASGGVYTSARDMAAYCRFHLQQGRVDDHILLREDLWAEMHSFSLGGDYGLGVIRQDLRYGNEALRMFGHQGGGFGFGCVFNYCPAAELAWVAMFNRPVAAAYRFGAGLLDAVLTSRYGPRRARLPASDIPVIDLQISQQQQLLGNYIGRGSFSELTLRDGTAGLLTAGRFEPLQFSSPTDCFTTTPDGDAVAYRIFAGQVEPAHLECAIAENSLDYNDGPFDPPGPDRPQWREWLGQYRIYRWGRPFETLDLSVRNGYLYLGRIRLVAEHEPGLFFTSDGEAVDFRNSPATWKSIRLQRLSS